MENYEVKNVTLAEEIKKVYETAVKENYHKYRAISKSGLIYGWDKQTNKHVKALDGQEWFDNPHYKAPIEEKVEEPIIEKMVEVANEMVEEVKAEEVVEKEPEVDYKALYEEKCGEFDALKEEYENAKQCADYYKQESEQLKDGLYAFKTLLNKF